MDIDDGLWEMVVTATDFVLNVATRSSGGFEVIHDVQPPRTSLVIGDPKFGAEPTFMTKSTPLGLNAIDDLVEVGDSKGLGVVATKFSIDGSVFSTFFTTLSIATEGLHVIRFFSKDIIGNRETVRISSVAVDGTPPVTTLVTGEPLLIAFGLRLITPQTPISLSAVDPLSNGVASGVREILFSIDQGPPSIFSSTFTLSQGTYQISFQSRDNLGNLESLQTVKVAVTMLQEAALIGVGGVTASGTADMVGNIISNGAFRASGNVRVNGNVTAAQISLTGKSTISGVQSIKANAVSSSPIDLAALHSQAESSNNNNQIPSNFLVNGELRLNAQQSLTLSAGTYLLSGMSISGGVYAPNTSLSMNGGVAVTGHLFSKDATITGTSLVLQSGTQAQLASAGNIGAKSANALAMSPLESDASFKLRELYAYPNPAVGGTKPTLHIETGIADSVCILIFNLSGELIVETTLNGQPQIIDDGQGAQYAYEWLWEGHIPSGTYLYVVETRKGSETLRAKGKIYVVR
ncbi:MAG: T9SS type A sorting domain-containing protein [Elusimicrobia bacterium]|nr:T9SS type A sorting domain-containing protein [Elusimicrobiota bacterium]